jgi:hypothetical protein
MKNISQASEAGDINKISALFLSLLILISWHLIFRKYFPLPGGMMGHDYTLALPGLIDGYIWYLKNGFISPPWFTPSFNAGQPFFADPQSIFYSAPQFLVFFFDLIDAIYMSVLLFAISGFVGMYLFVRIHLSVDRWRSLICATIFLFNGFYIHRMIIGHFGFQAFMLVPFLAMALLTQLSDHITIRKDIFASAIAGVILGYCFQAGLTTLIIPATMSVAALILLKLVMESKAISSALYVRLFFAIIVSIGLSASKLVAGLSLMQHFARDFYSLPGINSIYGVLLAVFQMLFYSSEHAYQTLSPLWSNMQWAALPHELAFGLTPLVFLVLILWLVFNHAVLRIQITSNRNIRLPLILLSLIFMIPIVMLYYSPEWNNVLKKIPLVGSTTSPWRWMIIMIPALSLLGGLAVGKSGSYRYISGIILLAGIPLLNSLEDRSFYDSQNTPNEEMIDFHKYIKSGKISPAIQQIVNPQTVSRMYPTSLFALGLSPIACYNPLFGYRLEKLNFEKLQPGSYLIENNGHYNFRNPACMVFPEENNCNIWDNFSTNQKKELESFVSYRGFSFVKSKIQSVADFVTLMTLLSLLIYFSGAATLRWRVRR